MSRDGGARLPQVVAHAKDGVGGVRFELNSIKEPG